MYCLCAFFVFVETLPTVCGTSFFPKKMHLVRLKTSNISTGSATCCPNSGPISGRTSPSVWTPRARPEDQRDFRPDHAAMYVCMLN